nr:hypothetical protein [Tanacetum cinerariifolium]
MREKDAIEGRWAGQAPFGTLTPDIVVFTLLYCMMTLKVWKEKGKWAFRRKGLLTSLLVCSGSPNGFWVSRVLVLIASEQWPGYGLKGAII